MVRALPEKCRKCAMLSAQQAQALHRIEGDGCWNPAICYSRRSYIRNRDRFNQTRSRKCKEAGLAEIPVAFKPLSQLVFGVLIVHRKAGADTPVHGIAAEIWQGQEKVAIASRYASAVAGKPIVPPVHCAGLVPSQVHIYMGKMLNVLEE